MAVQHAQYSQLVKSGTSPEHLCAEKIAEQQLRIKQVTVCVCVCVCVCVSMCVNSKSTLATAWYVLQAKVHQKLMDVQYQLRMSGDGVNVIVGGGVSESGASRQSYLTTNPKQNKTTVSSVSTPSSSTTGYSMFPATMVQSEILKHEVQCSKVTT